MAALKDKYKSEIVPQLKEELGLANVMEVPRITKITLNMGVGRGIGRQKSVGKRSRRHGEDLGSEGCCNQGSQINRGLQG